MSSNSSRTILIVEDDEVTREKMAAYFETEGYTVLISGTALESKQLIEQSNIDLALVDINLPDGDGLELARDIRSKSNMGIIFVTGRNDDIDRIVGLEIGADDYVTKPFNSRELLARVKGLLRRAESATRSTVEVREFSGWTFDLLRRTLTTPDQGIVELTRAELELVDLFTRNPGATLSRERLMHTVTHRFWNPGDRTIDVLIRRLRKKIEIDSSNPKTIKTIHGEGYMFCDNVTLRQA